MYTEKNIMKRVVYGLLTVVLVSLAWFNSSMAAEGPLLLELAKTNIKISTFYNGTTLDVAGSLPADEDVVVQLSGPKFLARVRISSLERTMAAAATPALASGAKE